MLNERIDQWRWYCPPNANVSEQSKKLKEQLTKSSFSAKWNRRCYRLDKDGQDCVRELRRALKTIQLLDWLEGRQRAASTKDRSQTACEEKFDLVFSVTTAFQWTVERWLVAKKRKLFVSIGLEKESEWPGIFLRVDSINVDEHSVILEREYLWKSSQERENDTYRSSLSLVENECVYNSIQFNFAGSRNVSAVSSLTSKTELRNRK